MPKVGIHPKSIARAEPFPLKSLVHVVNHRRFQGGSAVVVLCCLVFDVSFEAVFTLCMSSLYEPRCEKTGLRGFRPGPTQTGL